MKTSVFDIDKTSSYRNGAREFETYRINMNGKSICDIHRELAEELLCQLELALNDRKEANDGKKQQ